MKRIILIIITAILILTGCSKGSNENEIIPVYQGMSLEVNNTMLSSLTSDIINDSIAEDLGIKPSEEIDGYTKPGSRATINIRLYNPKQYEILSFILNGTKYQSFQFNKDSTGELIRLDITMPADSGIYDFKIDSVKYINNNEIKDCIMDGKTAIRVGVEYLNKPYASLSSSSSYNSITLSANILDPDSVIEKSNGLVRAYLFDSVGIVDKFDIATGRNDISFSGLYDDKEYNYVIASSIDLLDGRGIRSYIIASNIIRTKSLFLTRDEEITTTSIKFNIENSYSDIKLDKIELILNNRVIKTVYTNNAYFDGLLSNTRYNIKISYLENKDKKELIKEYNTKALAKPIVECSAISNSNTIKLGLRVVDSDNIFRFDEVAIYLRDSLVKSFNNYDNLVIDDLIANQEYKIIIKYHYDLNDGNGTIYDSYTHIEYTESLPISINSYEILNANAPKTNEDISIRLRLNNNSGVRVGGASVNGKYYEALGGDGINDIIVNVRAGARGGVETFIVDELTYELDGLISSSRLKNKLNINVTVLSRLDVIGANLVNGSNVFTGILDEGLVLRLDNYQGYRVIEVNGRPVKMIDSNNIFIEGRDLDKLGCDFELRSILYEDTNGSRAIRNYDAVIKCNYTLVKPDEETNTILINKIERPEDLLNTKPGFNYEIVNDLDMSGYRWDPMLVNGNIDARGHKISGISFIYEDEYSDYYKNEIRLHNATISNAYFDKLYISASSKSSYIYLANAINSCYSGGISTSPNMSITFPDKYHVIASLRINGLEHNENLVSNEVFNTKDFKEGTLGWLFLPKEYKEYNGLSYFIVNDSYIIIDKYIGNEERVVIPNTIDNKPVIGIEGLAFMDSNIVSLTMPDNVYYMGGSILSGCQRLSELHNLTIRSNYLGFLFGSRVYKNSYKQKNYYIPNSLRYIEINKLVINDNYMFQNLTSLETLIFKDNSTNIIYNGLCQNCTSLSKLILPDGLIKIEYGAFWECNKLTEVIIPNSVIEIEEHAFKAFQANFNKVVIGSNVKRIGKEAFDVNSIKDLYLPKSVEYISKQAFSNVTGNLYYEGSEEDFSRINIEADNFTNPNLVKHYNSKY